MNYLLLFSVLIIIVCICYYIISRTRNEDFTIFNHGIEVRSNSLAGRGIFATQLFKKGETIEICPCLKDDDNNFTGTLADYVFSYGDDKHSVLALGYCSLINHSDSPNCQWVWSPYRKDMIMMVALRDIKPGEELLHSYGSDWFDQREYLKKGENNESSGFY